MSKEIQFTGTTGSTHYVLVFNSVGQVWNGSAFEAYAAGSYANYDVAATEFGASGVFSADMPAAVAGVYGVVAKKQAGGSPAQSDTTAAAGELHWDGTAVISRNAVGLATPAEASGRPTTLAGMIRRLFEWEGGNKRTRNRTTGVVTLRNAADGANLATATQSTAGDTDTQTGAA